MKSPSPQAGYNLVMLMVLLMVLNIMVAASLPSWSSMIRREKEEELIFRGLQYAEAIRVFQNRFQRSPVRLEELLEVEPRSIRQLWKDPMTEDGKWVLIPLQGPVGMQVQPPNGDPGQGNEEGPGDSENGRGGEGEGEGLEDGDDSGFGPKNGEIQIGPFKGVHSRSGKTSFLLFNGKERYDEWHFTVELLTGASGGPMSTGGPGGAGVPPPVNPNQQFGQQPAQMSARWIGRPLPEFLVPRQGTGLPDEDGGAFPEDQNGRPPRRGTGKP
jgi:type II secretory pathway pseudopilin PulG